MNRLYQITSANFEAISEKIKDGQRHFLPMIFGTSKEAQKQTAWLEAYDDQYLWLLHDQGEDHCLYVFQKQSPALWFSFILPSDWDRRFDIFSSSLPHVMTWFKENGEYQYFYGKMEAQDTPPTLLEGYLPSFLDSKFKTEHRMWLRRASSHPMPTAINLPTPFSQEPFKDDRLDEVAGLVSSVFLAENVDFSLEDAQEEIMGVLNDELFTQSAMLIRDQSGKLVATGWCYGSNPAYPGEVVVHPKYQGHGLGRYMLNECIRTLSTSHPEQDITICTCREWIKAVRLYESYDFVPYDFWTYISFNKEIG